MQFNLKGNSKYDNYYKLLRGWTIFASSYLDKARTEIKVELGTWSPWTRYVHDHDNTKAYNLFSKSAPSPFEMGSNDHSIS